jgi:hypothetical protein
MEEYIRSFLVPALLMFPLLGGIPTEAAVAAANDALCINENHAPPVRHFVHWINHQGGFCQSNF